MIAWLTLFGLLLILLTQPARIFGTFCDMAGRILIRKPPPSLPVQLAECRAGAARSDLKRQMPSRRA
jgi:hypothetical protein